jgi:hypothetical protein
MTKEEYVAKGFEVRTDVEMLVRKNGRYVQVVLRPGTEREVRMIMQTVHTFTEPRPKNVSEI